MSTADIVREAERCGIFAAIARWRSMRRFAIDMQGGGNPNLR
jgi:hypothetical protein